MSITIVERDLPSKVVRVLNVIYRVRTTLRGIFATFKYGAVRVSTSSGVYVVNGRDYGLVICLLLVRLRLIMFNGAGHRIVIRVVVWNKNMYQVRSKTVNLCRHLTNGRVLISIVLNSNSIRITSSTFILLGLGVDPLTVISRLLRNLLRVIRCTFFHAQGLNVISNGLDLRLLY